MILSGNISFRLCFSLFFALGRLWWWLHLCSWLSLDVSLLCFRLFFLRFFRLYCLLCRLLWGNCFNFLFLFRLLFGSCLGISDSLVNFFFRFFLFLLLLHLFFIFHFFCLLLGLFSLWGLFRLLKLQNRFFLFLRFTILGSLFFFLFCWGMRYFRGILWWNYDTWTTNFCFSRWFRVLFLKLRMLLQWTTIFSILGYIFPFWKVWYKVLDSRC